MTRRHDPWTPHRPPTCSSSAPARSGLVAACELARRGVTVRLVDRLTEPTTESRALLVHARSLEMLDRMGVADRLLETGIRTHRMTMYAEGHELAHMDFGRVASPFPYSLTTAQTETERVLDRPPRASSVSPSSAASS